MLSLTMDDSRRQAKRPDGLIFLDFIKSTYLTSYFKMLVPQMTSHASADCYSMVGLVCIGHLLVRLFLQNYSEKPSQKVLKVQL